MQVKWDIDYYGVMSVGQAVILSKIIERPIKDCLALLKNHLHDFKPVDGKQAVKIAKALGACSVGRSEHYSDKWPASEQNNWSLVFSS